MCGGSLNRDDALLTCDGCGYAAMVPSGRAKTSRDYERAGIPKRYYDAIWNDPRGNVSKEGKGLYIQGTTNGTGKTRAAMAVARACVHAGWNVQCTSGVRILSMLRDAMGDDSESVFRKLSRADLLVIDDLGKENPTEWVVSMLYRVIDERYGSMRTTIVTSNYSKSELVERLTVGGDSSTAESIVSRLFEMTVKVEIEGEDRRLS